jgi:chaperonin GroEL
MVVNKMRGILPLVAVKAPDFGDRKKAMLDDIAVLTGGQVVSHEKGMRLDKFDIKWLGKATKATVTKDTTTIIDALGEEEQISNRVSDIKTLIEESNSPFEKENLQDRLAKFLGGVAIVHVGGHTEVEMKEKKDRVDDALHATKAALQEGILPGGGIALLNAALHLTGLIGGVAEESQIGYDIVVNAIERPFYKILLNAGFSNVHIGELEESIKESGDQWVGYNPRTEKIVNMFDEGIIDPTKVTRLSLENAASVAGTLLITEAVVSKGKDKKEAAPGIDPSMLMG